MDSKGWERNKLLIRKTQNCLQRPWGAKYKWKRALCGPWATGWAPELWGVSKVKIELHVFATPCHIPNKVWENKPHCQPGTNLKVTRTFVPRPNSWGCQFFFVEMLWNLLCPIKRTNRCHRCACATLENLKTLLLCFKVSNDCVEWMCHVKGKLLSFYLNEHAIYSLIFCLVQWSEHGVKPATGQCASCHRNFSVPGLRREGRCLTRCSLIR